MSYDQAVAAWRYAVHAFIDELLAAAREGRAYSQTKARALIATKTYESRDRAHWPPRSS